VIGQGVLNERLFALLDLLVQALEELEAGRTDSAVEALVELGDKLIAARAQGVAERRLLDRMTGWLLKLIEAGEQRQP
jgi:hypothetical protein